SPMNTLVLIGLALIAVGLVLLAVRFAPRVRRQFAAQEARPRTVADLVRLREQSIAQGARAAVGDPPKPAAQPAAAQPAEPAAPQAERPTPRKQPAQAAAEPTSPEAPATPAFVPPPPRPAPVAGRVQREAPEPPKAALDGDNSPWQRGARMAVGLGGGQPWREPPAPPAALRVVEPASEGSGEAEEPAVTAGPAVRLVGAEAAEAPSAAEEAQPPAEAGEPGAGVGDGAAGPADARQRRPPGGGWPYTEPAEAPGRCVEPGPESPGAAGGGAGDGAANVGGRVGPAGASLGAAGPAEASQGLAGAGGSEPGAAGGSAE